MDGIDKIIDQELENRILKALLSYDKLCSILLDELEPRHFSSTIKSKLFSCIVTYYSMFGERPPSDDMVLMTCKEMYNQDDAKVMHRLLVRIQKIPVPGWDWILKKVDSQVKAIKLNKALYESTLLAGEGHYEKARDNLVSLLQQPSLGFSSSRNDLDMTEAAITDLAMQEESMVCPTRIYALDDSIDGLMRQEAFLILAPTNVGKSWAALHLAVSALISGKRVIFFTLEMSKKYFMQRLLQNISGTFAPKYEGHMEKSIELWDEDFQSKSEETRPSLLQVSKVSQHLKVLQKFGGILDVRQYNDGEVTMGNVERDIHLFDTVHEGTPDVIIVDGLLNFDLGDDPNKHRHVLASNAKKLRALAMDYNCSVVATHQANRDGNKKEVDVVDLEHTGESFKIVQTFDTAISLNQTKKEARIGEMRISVMRARNKKKHGYIRVYQNLEIGQFCQASVDMNAEKEAQEFEEGEEHDVS